MIGAPVLLLLALQSEPAPAPPQAVTSQATPQETPKTATGTGNDVRWAPTFAEAVERARSIPGGRLLIELSSADCAECRRQESLVIPSRWFLGFMEDKVPVRVGFSSPEGRKMAERFGVPAPPAWIITTTDGLLCGIQGGATNQGEFFQTFEKTEKSWAGYQRKLAQEQKNPGDLELVFAVAQETYQRGGDDVSEPRFQRLASSKNASPAIRDRSLAFLASIEMDQKRFDDAEKHLRTLLSASDTKLRERAELRLADIEIAKGRRDLAIGRLRQFRKDHADSPLAAEAGELLDRLETKGQAKEETKR